MMTNAQPTNETPLDMQGALVTHGATGFRPTSIVPRSQRASKSALAAARGGIVGQSLVFILIRAYNMKCSLTSPKAKDPLSACNAAGPSNTPRRISPMVRLRYTTDSITHLANPNPSDTQFERTVSRLAVL
jgi:hypothetical protein